MAQRDTIQSLEGALIYISATRPDTFDAVGYESTDLVWTVIGEVDQHGNHGMTATVTNFTSVNDGVVQKVKGSKDYGNMDMSMGYVPSDAGQALLATASESNDRYSFKIVYPLGDGETTNEAHYLDALVPKYENQDGQVNDVRKLSVTVAICRKPVVVAAT